MTIFIQQSSQFLNGFHSSDHKGFADAWNDVRQPPMSVSQGRQNEAGFAEFEQIYDHVAAPQNMSTLDGRIFQQFSQFTH